MTISGQAKVRPRQATPPQNDKTQNSDINPMHSPVSDRLASRRADRRAGRRAEDAPPPCAGSARRSWPAAAAGTRPCRCPAAPRCGRARRRPWPRTPGGGGGAKRRGAERTMWREPKGEEGRRISNPSCNWKSCAAGAMRRQLWSGAQDPVALQPVLASTRMREEQRGIDRTSMHFLRRERSTASPSRSRSISSVTADQREREREGGPGRGQRAEGEGRREPHGRGEHVASGRGERT